MRWWPCGPSIEELTSPPATQRVERCLERHSFKEWRRRAPHTSVTAGQPTPLPEARRTPRRAWRPRATTGLVGGRLCVPSDAPCCTCQVPKARHRRPSKTLQNGGFHLPPALLAYSLMWPGVTYCYSISDFKFLILYTPRHQKPTAGTCRCAGADYSTPNVVL